MGNGFMLVDVGVGVVCGSSEKRCVVVSVQSLQRVGPRRPPRGRLVMKLVMFLFFSRKPRQLTTWQFLLWYFLR